jgi:hypothetical protein
MPCVWSQVSKKKCMKIPYNFQDRKIGYCATVWASLWRHPDAPQCLADWIEDVQMSEQHRPNARLSVSNFYMELNFKNRHCWEGSASRLDDMATRPDAVQHFRIFQCSVRTPKGVIAKTVRTYTCYGKNYAILEGSCRRPSARGNLPSRRSTTTVRICLDLGFL